jgi:hypothetical protein
VQDGGGIRPILLKSREAACNQNGRGGVLKDMTAFTVTPVESQAAHQLRGRIADGRLAARRIVLDEAGAPCRQCLQPGKVGEEMLLFTYQPFRGDSPYAVPSPIFLHAEACQSYNDADRLPELVVGASRNVRSYDTNHGLVDGEVAEGEDVESYIAKLLGNPKADYIHLYSATAGCFTCRIDRS